MTLFKTDNRFHAEAIQFASALFCEIYVKICCPLLTTLLSGSPIIQDGKLVGAVTHVMVANPTEGYGIFIENMLSASQMTRNELPAA